MSLNERQQHARAQQLQHAVDVLSQLVGSHANAITGEIRQLITPLIDTQVEIVANLQKEPQQ